VGEVVAPNHPPHPIRVFGDAAVEVGTWTGTGTSDGKKVPSEVQIWTRKK
jgi:hypothetical protein